jgi:DNA polymerase I-like protein with 3'-5' exonuclease and polymerase domains
VSDYAVIDIETTGSEPWRHELVSVGIGRNVHRPDKGRAFARMLMARPGTVIVAHTNYDLRWLMLDGATLGPDVHYHDTKVMAWLLDPTQELDLDSLAQRYLGYSPPKLIRMRSGVVCFLCASGDVVPITEAPWEEVEAYNRSDIVTEGELYETLRTALKDEGLWDYFVNEKAPLSRLLVEMEVHGLPFDVEGAKALLVDTEARAETLRAELVERTGALEFNPGSSDQVRRWLYEEVWESPVRFAIPRLNGMTKEAKLEAVRAIAPQGVDVTKVGRDYGYGVQVLDGLGLKPPRIPKFKLDEAAARGVVAQPTTSAKKLNVLHGAHPWVSRFVEFKKADKLAGYLRSWIEKEHDGRLHGRFDQSGTITGRLAGREPNLQQVDNGVRDLFKVRADSGRTLIVGDFGGLEARLGAHFSGDPVMVDIFRNGKDLYGTLAARAWGGPESKDNPGRGLFKVVWLASQYGAQGQTLADTMAINGMHGYTARKADALLRELEATCPRLFEWRNEVIEEARFHGYVTTLAGRKRKLPDLDSATWKLMARAERQAVNTKVQGSAADVVERVMLEARKAVDPSVAAICLQVHDEILWDLPEEAAEEVFPVLVELCQTAHGFELDVPLIFEAKVATSWAAKEAAAPGRARAGWTPMRSSTWTRSWTPRPEPGRAPEITVAPPVRAKCPPLT